MGLSGLSALSGLSLGAAASVAPSAPEHSTTNLWINYRATAETVTKSGVNVTSWAKTAGSGSTAMANVSAQYPTWNATDSKLNNRPSIKFGANDQVLAANVVGTINTSAGSITGVLWMNALADVGVIFGFLRPSTAVRVQIECTASAKMGIDLFDGSSFNTTQEGATSFVANTAYVVTAIWTATNWYLRRNGAQIATVANSHSLDNVETGGGGIIMAFGGNVPTVSSPTITEETEFTLAEYVHYLAVDNTNIATVENALASWYGITF